MTVGGWIFMLVSWGVIIGLFIFCMIRTLHPGQTTIIKEKANTSLTDTETSSKSGQ